MAFQDLGTRFSDTSDKLVTWERFSPLAPLKEMTVLLSIANLSL